MQTAMSVCTVVAREPGRWRQEEELYYKVAGENRLEYGYVCLLHCSDRLTGVDID